VGDASVVAVHKNMSAEDVGWEVVCCKDNNRDLNITVFCLRKCAVLWAVFKFWGGQKNFFSAVRSCYRPLHHERIGAYLPVSSQGI